jgi:hypothetical protein
MQTKREALLAEELGSLCSNSNIFVLCSNSNIFIQIQIQLGVSMKCDEGGGSK